MYLRGLYWVHSCLTTSLVIWMIEPECTLSKFTDDMKLQGMAGPPSRGSCCHPESPQKAREISWKEPHEVQQVKNPAPAKEQLCTNPCSESGSWKAALHKRIWGSCLMLTWPWDRSVPLHNALCIRQSTGSKSREVILSLFIEQQWGHTWSAVSSSRLLSTGETWTYWNSSKKDHQDD